MNQILIVKTGERARKNSYDGIKIYSIDDIQKTEYSTDFVFIISESPFINKMYYDLYKCGLKKVYALNAEYLAMLDNDIKKLITCFDLNDKPIIGYLETHLFNQCNLNCKGCTHFSNIDNTDFMSLEEYEENISKLSDLYNINTFRLMGGEPLLNKNLGQYIKVTRKYFPNSNIDIATNGLLIYQMDKNLINILKENNIILKISLYLPIEKIKSKINQFLEDNDIKHFYGNGCKQIDGDLLIRDFHKCLTTKKKYDAEYNSKNCFARECWFLKGKFICKCATPLQINLLNENFGTNFILEDKDYIDISNLEKGSWDEIKILLSTMDFCSYCSPVEIKYRWEIKNTNQKLSDYIIEEED